MRENNLIFRPSDHPLLVWVEDQREKGVKTPFNIIDLLNQNCATWTLPPHSSLYVHRSRVRTFKRSSAFRESASPRNQETVYPVTVNILDLCSLSIFYFLHHTAGVGLPIACYSQWNNFLCCIRPETCKLLILCSNWQQSLKQLSLWTTVCALWSRSE